MKGLFLLLTLLVLLIASAREASARLPEPDVVYFGTVAGGSAGSFLKLKLDADGSTLATAAVGSDLSFVLRVPMDSLEPRSAGSARSGDNASLYMGEKVLRTLVIPERGSLMNLALSAAPATVEDWNRLHPGDNGSGDLNRNGSTDLQEFLDGNDPAGCVWVEADQTTRESRVYDARVLQNCLNEAQGDGRHNLILLAQGNYYGNFSYRALEQEDFDLRLVGGYDPAGTGTAGERLSRDPARTVLVGDVDRNESKDGRVLDISAGPGPSASTVRIEGVRIVYGGTDWTSATDRNATDGIRGGGLRVLTGQANLELVGNMFSDNFAFFGGAVFVASNGSGSVLVADNLIANNAAFYSGALRISSTGTGAVTLLNNTVADNWSENEGEGESIHIESVSAPVELVNNIVRGVYVEKSDIAVLGNGGSFPLTIRNNVILGGDKVKTYLPDFVPDASNTTDDPWFLRNQSGAYYYFPTDGDYRLQAGSPCVNRGAAHPLQQQVDAEGRERVAGAAVDIGAYERPLNVEYGSPQKPEDPVIHTELSADGFTARQAITGSADFTIVGKVQGPAGIEGLSLSLESGPDENATPWQSIPLGADGSFSFSPTLVPGENWLHFEVTRRDQVKVSFWYLVLFDTEPPTATLSTSAPAAFNAAPLSVSLSFSQAVTGLEAADLLVGNGSIVPGSFSGSRGEYRFSVQPAAEGTVSVQLPSGVARDVAGNPNLASNRLDRRYDISRPAVLLASPLPSATYVTPIPVTVSFSEPTAGFDQSKLSVQNGSVGSFTATATGFAFEVTPSGPDTVVTVQVPAGAVLDAAGNASAAVQLVRHYAPPIVVTLLPPETTVSLPGGYYNSAITLTMSATGGAAIYYTLDGSAPSTSSTRYGGAGIAIDQSTTLRYFAVDAVGTREEPVRLDYVIDKTLPVLSLSTLADGRSTNSATLNVAGVASDDSGIKTLTVNGSTVTVGPGGGFSFALALQPGANTVVTKAVDLAGNEAGDSRIIWLDQHATVLRVGSPADNSKTAAAFSVLAGSTEDGAQVAVLVNGQPVANVTMSGNRFSGSVPLSVGANTIEITATNPAGSATTVKRSVFYDNRKPSLAILQPGQDLQTNLGSVLVKGSVSDSQTAVTVTVNDTPVTVSPDGSFETSIQLGEQRSYQVLVQATDEAGNLSFAQRNVIYDATAPVFTVPVISPSNDLSQTIVGAREAGTSISVACPTATVGAVSYPDERRWEVTLSALSAGDNRIEVTGSDAAGNSAVQHAVITAGRYYEGPRTVAFGAPEGMTVYYSTDGSTPTTSSTRYTGPITVSQTTTYSYFATDVSGNRSSVTTVTYTIDTSPPTLTLSALSDGSVTANALFTLSGNATDDTRVASLTVNDAAVALGEAGAFGATLVLHAGANVITTVATDMVGNRRTDTRTVTLQQGSGAGPALVVSTLADGSATNVTPLNLTGAVSDPGGIASLTINGATVAVAPDGSYSYALPFAAAGDLTVSVAAANKGGGLTTDSRKITFAPTLPRLTVSAPADNSWTKETTLTVTGSVSDAGLVKLTNLTNNATTQAARSGDSFTGFLPLVNGLNTVEGSLVDGSGKKLGTVKRSVVCAPDAPALAIEDPPEDIVTTYANYLLRGAEFDYANVSLSLAVDGVSLAAPTVENGRFQKTLPLASAKSHLIAVTATNGAGVSATALRNIIRHEVTLADAMRALQIAVGVVQKGRNDELLDVAPLAGGVPAPDGAVDVGDAVVLLRRSIDLETW